MLLDQPLNDRTRDQLIACFEALPAANVNFLGVLPARSAGGVRLMIEQQLPDEVPACLRSLERFETVSWQLTDRLPDRWVLHLDVGDQLGPAIGLELSYLDDEYFDEAWRSLIERLTALKLCPVDTAAALEAWPGVSQVSDGSRYKLRPTSTSSW
jgi:hypothetical protein